MRVASVVAALAVRSASADDVEVAVNAVAKEGLRLLEHQGGCWLLSALAKELTESDLSRSARSRVERFAETTGRDVARTLGRLAFPQNADALESLAAFYELLEVTEVSPDVLRGVFESLFTTSENNNPPPHAYRFAAKGLDLLSAVASRRSTRGCGAIETGSDTGAPVMNDFWLQILARAVAAVEASHQLTLEKKEDDREGAASELAMASAHLATGLSHPGGGYSYYLSSPSISSLALWDLALKCTSHPRRSIGLKALDAWLDLQDIPLKQRHPKLTQPTYRRLLDVLVTQCVERNDDEEECYDEDEEDAGESFREAAADVFVAAYASLRIDFVTCLHARLKKNLFEDLNLRDAEATVFAFGSAAKEICEDVKGRRFDWFGHMKVAVISCLGSALEFVNNSGSLVDTDFFLDFVCTASRAFGAFSSLIGGGDNTVVSHSARFLCAALGLAFQRNDRGLAETSSKAFRALCIAAPTELFQSSPDILLAAHTAAADFRALLNLAEEEEDFDEDVSLSEHRARVVEGTARVVLSAARNNTNDDQMMLRIAFEPSVNALKGAGHCRCAVVGSLILLETAARFTRDVEKLRGPLAAEAWPLLSHCHATFPRKRVVVDKALSFHLALVSASNNFQDQRAVIDAALQYYEAHRWTCALLTVSKGVEAICCDRHSKSDINAFVNGVLRRVASPGLLRPDNTNDNDDDRQLFETLKNCLLFCPEALDQATLRALWDLALLKLAHPSSGDAARAVANLISLLAKHDQAVGHQRAVDLLVATLATASSNARPALADALHAVVAIDVRQGTAYLQQLQTTNSTPQQFLEALASLIPEKPRFKALAVDLAKINAGEISIDAACL